MIVCWRNSSVTCISFNCSFSLILLFFFNNFTSLLWIAAVSAGCWVGRRWRYCYIISVHIRCDPLLSAFRPCKPSSFPSMNSSSISFIWYSLTFVFQILAVGTEPVVSRFDMNGDTISKIQCAPQSSFSVSLHSSGVSYVSDCKTTLWTFLYSILLMGITWIHDLCWK